MDYDEVLGASTHGHGRVPLVSVVLPVRDEAAHLPESIDSLVRQTMSDFEVLAVDDGSSDESAGILRRWAEADERVRVLTRGRQGLVASLELARLHARGRFLARMDADDVAHPERLQHQLALMREQPELTGCGCMVRYVPRSRIRGGALRYERWLNGLVTPSQIERDLFVECPLAHPTFFLDASAVAAVGGYRDKGWPEDYDLILRLWEAGARFAKVPRVLLDWRERPERLSRVHPSYAHEAFQRLKIDVLGRTLLRGRRGVVVWGAGPTGKAFARGLSECGVAILGFVDLDPRKIGQRIRGAAVWPPHEVKEPGDAFAVAAVAQPGAREHVRTALHAKGWREGEDFVAVA